MQRFTKQIVAAVVAIVAITSVAADVYVTPASSWRRMSYLEPPRSEKIITFNTDTLFNHPTKAPVSLYAKPIANWERSEQQGADTIFNGRFTFPHEWLGREVILRLEYVDAPYIVMVNDEFVGYSNNGNTPTEFNLTDKSKNGLNHVTIELSPNAEVRKIESWRKSNWDKKQSVEKIIRGAMVMSPAKMTMRDVYVKSYPPIEGQISAEIGVALKSYNLGERVSKLHYNLRDSEGKLIAYGNEDRTLRLRGEDTIRINTIISDEIAWSNKSPNRYMLDLRLVYDGRNMEFLHVPIAMRSVEMQSAIKDGAERNILVINGKEQPLTYSKVKPTATEQEIAALLQKGVNTVVISAGEHPGKLLDICDSLGMYSIITAPINSSVAGKKITKGGNPSNDPRWISEYMARVENAYHVAKMHPSLIAIAIAESSRNGYNLYEAYVRMKKLDTGLPILYFDVDGEWNSDNLYFQNTK
ncbi:MAG: glycoside hydrolase family 2 TIM barrel-domain containing protein [Rikenellaceae bacterium]